MKERFREERNENSNPEEWGKQEARRGKASPRVAEEDTDNTLESIAHIMKSSYADNDKVEATRRFAFQGQKIRTISRGGQSWFVAADVCAVLDIANTSQATSRLDEDERGVAYNDTLGGKQEMTVINESGLYNLVWTSMKPEAKAFRRWVTQEVLPSIHRTGAYRADNSAQRRINSATSSFTIPGPGRYVVMALPNGEMNVHQTEYATVVPEMTALDCRIMACACINIANLWEKLQELQAIGYNPTSESAMKQLGKAILSGSEIGWHYFYACDKPAIRPAEAAGGEERAE